MSGRWLAPLLLVIPCLALGGHRVGAAPGHHEPPVEAAALPIAVAATIEAGMPAPEVAGLVAALERGGLESADLVEVLRYAPYWEALSASSRRGGVDPGPRGFVEAALSARRQGPALVAAVRAELRRRGIPAGHDAWAAAPPPGHPRFVFVPGPVGFEDLRLDPSTDSSRKRLRPRRPPSWAVPGLERRSPPPTPAKRVSRKDRVT